MTRLKLTGICIAITILVTIFGTVLLQDKQYAAISFVAVIISLVPFFAYYEKKNVSTKELVVISIMIAFCVGGRFLFAAIPAFKPVTAIIIITAIYFGAEAGFITGALSAVISNFYFGQGPWTPVQMITWGLIGFTAGLLAKPLLRSKVLLVIYSIIAGIAFSLIMDIWTVLWWDNAFSLSRYLVAITAAIPFMLTYAVSNVVFILILIKPIGKKVERLKVKYGL